MKRKLSPGIVLLSVYFLMSLGIPITEARVEEKQVDIIIIKRPPMLDETGEKESVDVRQVARNLHNKEMFEKASRALHAADNALLSLQTVNLLKEALNQESEEIRIRAITLLGLSRNREAIAPILNRLQKDPSRRVRWSSAVQLGTLAGVEAIPALKTALTKDPKIKPAVIYGLGRAGGPAVPILLQMLEDEFKKNQIGDGYTIIKSLGNTGDRRAIEPLRDILLSLSIYSSAYSRSRMEAARVLANFATEYQYSAILRVRSKFSVAEAVTPEDINEVSLADRTMMINALQEAALDSDQDIQEFVRLALEEMARESRRE